MVKALLASKDTDERKALLVPRPGDFYVQVVGLLKDEADRERLRDPQAALRIADIAALVADFAAEPRCRALAAWARGNALIHQGDYTACLRLYQEAARFFASIGAEMEVARLNVNQAFVFKNLGRYKEGLAAIRRALTVFRRHPPSPFLASALNGLGTLYYLLGMGWFITLKVVVSGGLLWMMWRLRDTYASWVSVGTLCVLYWIVLVNNMVVIARDKVSV